MRTTYIIVRRCGNACPGIFAVARKCPECKAATYEYRIPSSAVIELSSVVHVSADGKLFNLGIASTAAGHTLCRIEGMIRGVGYDRVTLHIENDAFVAIGRGEKK